MESYSKKADRPLEQRTRLGADLGNSADFDLLQKKLKGWQIRSVTGPGEAHLIDLLIVDARRISDWSASLQSWRTRSANYLPVLALIPRRWHQAADLFLLAEIVDDMMMLPVRTWELAIRLRSLTHMSSFSKRVSVRTQTLLEQSENRYREIADLLTDYCYAVVFASGDSCRFRLSWQNQGLASLLKGEEQNSGHGQFNWLGKSGLIHFEQQLRLARQGQSSMREFRIANGRWVRHHMAPIREEDCITGAFAAIIDIDSQFRQLQELKQLRFAAEQSPNPVYLFDANSGEMILQNLAASRQITLPENLELITRCCNKLQPAGVSHLQLEERSRIFEFTLSRSAYSMESMEDEGNIVLVSGRDISERLRFEEALLYSQTHDKLTGLPNRAVFLELLDAAIKDLGESDQLSVVLFEFSNIRNVNESLGHEIGDRALVEAANLVKNNVPSRAHLARVGGNEYALLIERVTADWILTCAKRLIEKLAKGVNPQDQYLVLDSCFGIALGPDDGGSADQLLRHAESALRTAKEAGIGQVRFFRAEQNERSTRRIRLEAEMKQALRNQEFCLFYQPQWPTRAELPFAVEALIRWLHPVKGLIPPAEFIDVLEQSPIIHDVGLWVVEEACRQWQRWRDAGVESPRIAINVAPAQLANPDFLDELAKRLLASKIPPHLLELELTESTLMRDLEHGKIQLETLRALGISVALDDFGTGHSSLAYLAQLPFNRLKIDRAFVRPLPDDEKACELARTIALLGAGLNLKVVAEGVETKAQAKFLRQAGCHWLQGYWLSRPVSADEIPNLILKNEAWLSRHK